MNEMKLAQVPPHQQGQRQSIKATLTAMTAPRPLEALEKALADAPPRPDRTVFVLQVAAAVGIVIFQFYAYGSYNGCLAIAFVAAGLALTHARTVARFLTAAAVMVTAGAALVAAWF